MTTLHLIHGFVGVGKTTFAKKLEADDSKIRFTCDEWMITLFGTNPPKAYFEMYLDKIKQLIWRDAKKFLELGHDVILDFGFWRKIERDYYRKLGLDMGVEVKLYNLQCPEKERIKRVLARTSAMPPDAFIIDEHALQEFKRQFEPIEDESEESILINTFDERRVSPQT